MLAVVAMLLAAGAAAQSRDGDWASYRDAYRAMVVFEKYGKPKQLLQSQLQVSPREKGASLEGLRLSLNGKSSQLNLPLDATGRTVFPLLKAAYDENAELVLNQKPSLYVLKPRVTIIVRADGVYEVADLRAACEQALAYQRYVESGLHARQCAGVRFTFAKKADASVKLRKGGALPVVDGPAFADEAGDAFKVVQYRFADWSPTGQLTTAEAPLAISAVFE